MSKRSLCRTVRHRLQIRVVFLAPRKGLVLRSSVHFAPEEVHYGPELGRYPRRAYLAGASIGLHLSPVCVTPVACGAAISAFIAGGGHVIAYTSFSPCALGRTGRGVPRNAQHVPVA